MAAQDPPSFLIGCHRSGTTLVRFLLDSHPNIACPPESKFIAGLEAFFDYPQAAVALASLGYSAHDVYREIRRMIEAFLGGYARRQGKKRWVDKTPNYWRILPFLEEVFEGQARYLFLVRHPLDTVISLEETFHQATPRYEDPEIARSVERYGKGRAGWTKYWNEVYERIGIFAGAHAGRSLVFRYEDLVANPIATMGEVFAFLGEDLPKGLVRKAFRARHTQGFEDYKIRATQGIRSDGVGRWRSWPEPEVKALWEVVRPLAERFGYSNC